jgi:hypothetical protein
MYIIKIASIISIIYCSLNSTIERHKYPLNLKSSYIQEVRHKNTDKKLEDNKKNILRKKTWLDLKYHKRKKNPNPETILQLIINKEGKIVGYKQCNIFYPNYFTRNQDKSVIKTSQKFKLQKTKLCIIRFKT